MERSYDQIVREHFEKNRQMLFLHGPRQVGKTTTARTNADAMGAYTYINFDDLDSRQLFMSGPSAVADAMRLDLVGKKRPTCVLDEIHKIPDWRMLLKGLFDRYEDRLQILVTGSARLGVFGWGGDSLMGRYFNFHMHPLSVGELVGGSRPKNLVRDVPVRLGDDEWERLFRFGGFPEPFLRADTRFWRQWRRLRLDQLFREDLRDLTRIHETARIEVVAQLLRNRVGGLVSQSSLAKHVRASGDTIRRWLESLESLYYCFAVRPWHRNVSRALRKEPKYYLWDWSLVDDAGARAENMVASALLKSVHYWTDAGFGDFELRFMRDKEKREVDFAVIRDGNPWFLVEVKLSGNARVSPALKRFQEQSEAAHAFQVAMDLPFVDRNCFDFDSPVIVPAISFLSQFV